MKIGVIGGGVVGQATARSYLEHVEEVRVYDTILERRTHGYTETLQSDIIFICLPTPQKNNSLECNLDYVRGFFRELTLPQRGLNFVLRSTVPIGTTQKLAELFRLNNLVHSPEFLTARCANVDAQIPSRNIIGTPYGAKNTSIHCYLDLCMLYEKRFPQIRTHYLSSDESEAVKLFQNSFFAIKVAFWNEAQQLCTKLDMGWEVIREAILADGRIHPSHTKVPGPDGKYGYGGTCLPKDIANLIECFSQHDIEATICEAAYERNLTDRERG